jgi:hypothetical protein
MTEQEMYEIIAKKADEMKALIPETKEVLIAVNCEQGCETLVDAKDKGELVAAFLSIASSAAAAFIAADHPDVKEIPLGSPANKCTYVPESYECATVAKALGISAEEHMDAAARCKELL